MPYPYRKPKKKRRATPEFDFQAKEVVPAVKIALPKEATLFHSPNGGSRHPGEAARLRQMGVAPGIPDLGVVYPPNGQIAWIELKAPGGSLTPAQRHMHDRLRAAGCAVATCDSLEEVFHFLGSLMPLRARLR